MAEAQTSTAGGTHQHGGRHRPARREAQTSTAGGAHQREAHTSMAEAQTSTAGGTHQHGGRHRPARREAQTSTAGGAHQREAHTSMAGGTHQHGGRRTPAWREAAAWGWYPQGHTGKRLLSLRAFYCSLIFLRREREGKSEWELELSPVCSSAPTRSLLGAES
uniref:Uncharacterized protein n=1 Tax=Myotis myotis TaxID=51298 RepID=A0A7J7XZD3_MYOMY|nr:hypothetical protein mMyoMyo1_011314 [Myotis myotis]